MLYGLKNAVAEKAIAKKIITEKTVNEICVDIEIYLHKMLRKGIEEDSFVFLRGQTGLDLYGSTLTWIGCFPIQQEYIEDVLLRLIKEGGRKIQNGVLFDLR